MTSLGVRCECLEVGETLAALNGLRVTCKLGYKILDCQRYQDGMGEKYKTGKGVLVTCGKCGKIHAELEFLGKEIKKTNVTLETLWTAFMVSIAGRHK